MATRGTYFDASALNASPFGDALGKALLAGLGGYIQSQDRADERQFQGTQFAASQDRLRAQDERQTRMDAEGVERNALHDALSKIGLGIVDPSVESRVPGAGQVVADRKAEAARKRAMDEAMTGAQIKNMNAQANERTIRAWNETAKNAGHAVDWLKNNFLTGKGSENWRPFFDKETGTTVLVNSKTGEIKPLDATPKPTGNPQAAVKPADDGGWGATPWVAGGLGALLGGRYLYNKFGPSGTPAVVPPGAAPVPPGAVPPAAAPAAPGVRPVSPAAAPTAGPVKPGRFAGAANILGPVAVGAQMALDPGGIGKGAEHAAPLAGAIGAGNAAALAGRGALGVGLTGAGAAIPIALASALKDAQEADSAKSIDQGSTKELLSWMTGEIDTGDDVFTKAMRGWGGLLSGNGMSDSMGAQREQRLGKLEHALNVTLTSNPQITPMQRDQIIGTIVNDFRQGNAAQGRAGLQFLLQRGLTNAR